MSYFDSYKRRININGSDFNSSKKKFNNVFYGNRFKDSPSYRLAIVNEERELDIRLINTEKNDIKRISIRPDDYISEGDLLKFDNKIWLVMGVNENITSPQAEIIHCNKTLNYKGLSKLIPCVAQNALFYTLGQLDNDRFSHPDGKLTVYVKATKDTSIITEGMRFIFNHHDCFMVTFIDRTSKDSWYEITMKQTASLPNDDFENNIAYNEKKDNPKLGKSKMVMSVKEEVPVPKKKVELKGKERISFNTESEYEIISDLFDENVFNFSVNKNDIAEIVYSDNTRCIIRSKDKTEFVTLKATCLFDDELSVEKYILVRGDRPWENA